jgi:hypothetical protein
MYQIIGRVVVNGPDLSIAYTLLMRMSLSLRQMAIKPTTSCLPIFFFYVWLWQNWPFSAGRLLFPKAWSWGSLPPVKSAIDLCHDGAGLQNVLRHLVAEPTFKDSRVAAYIKLCSHEVAKHKSGVIRQFHLTYNCLPLQDDLLFHCMVLNMNRDFTNTKRISRPM